MKLQEAFEKYSDDKLLRRRKILQMFKEHVNTNAIFKDDTQEQKEERINSFISSKASCHRVGYLKTFLPWADEKFRKLGFIIPSFMIEDANADDWEIVE